MCLDVAEHEGKGQQLQGPAQDLTRGQGDRLVGQPAEVATGVRETEAVTYDGNEACANAQQLALAKPFQAPMTTTTPIKPTTSPPMTVELYGSWRKINTATITVASGVKALMSPASTAEMWVSP